MVFSPVFQKILDTFEMPKYIDKVFGIIYFQFGKIEMHTSNLHYDIMKQGGKKTPPNSQSMEIPKVPSWAPEVTS